jgi:hypothetical protein
MRTKSTQNELTSQLPTVYSTDLTGINRYPFDENMQVVAFFGLQ